MFGSRKVGASAYASVGLETGVLAASPHQLIVMLFDGALAAIASATQQMASGDIQAKSVAISKAACIVESGLRASLNPVAGGEIAANLDALYRYLTQRLMLANMQNDSSYLDEVAGLLRDLRDTWLAINPATSFAHPVPEQLTSFINSPV